jgi:hypothetical protein
MKAAVILASKSAPATARTTFPRVDLMYAETEPPRHEPMIAMRCIGGPCFARDARNLAGAAAMPMRLTAAVVAAAVPAVRLRLSRSPYHLGRRSGPAPSASSRAYRG